MRNLLSIIFLYLIIITIITNACGQELKKINQNHMLQAKVRVDQEEVAPSWRLVWDKAREMVRKKELDSAVALYRELLKDRQGLVEARWELALILMQLNKRSQAIFELEHVIDARPHDIQALSILVNLLSKSGQCDKAIAVYKNLVKELNLQSEHIRSAKKELKSVSEELSLTEILENLSCCLESQKRFKESIIYLRKAIATNPDRRDLEFNLACLLLRLKMVKSALQHFRQLMPYYESDPNFLTNYAKALLAVGDREMAIKIFKKLIVLFGEADSSDHKGDLIWGVNELVSLYLMEGDTKSALEVIEDLRRDHPEVLNKQLLSTLGRLHFASRNYLKALKTFKCLLAEEPNDKMGLLFMARTYERLQLFVPAIHIYKKLLFIEPDEAINMHLIELFLKTDNVDQAKFLFRENVGSYLESDLKRKKLLLKIYFDNGDTENIERLLEGENDLFNDNDILASYISFVTSIGYINDQIKFRLYNDALLTLVNQAEKRRFLIQNGVGLLLHFGQKDMADRILKQCWSESQSLWSINMLIDNYISRNMYKEAAFLLDAAILTYPSSRRLKIKQAYLLIDMEKVDFAKKTIFSIYLDNNWKWGEEKVLLCKGYISSLLGRYEEAFNYYEKILQEAPNHLEAHIGRRINFAAYGLRKKADAEAKGMEIITGTECPDLLYNKSKVRPVPMLVKNGWSIPSPGAYLNGLMRSDELLSPEDILGSPFCEIGGESCSLLLALSHEYFGNISEAIVMWLSFLKRHETYWPGYERLVQIYESEGEARHAKKLRLKACSKIKDLRFSFYDGDQDCNKAEDILEEVNFSHTWIWQKLDDAALSSWETIFCSN
jgi:tetratricopeptide (TPR) repeat protein